MKRSFLLFLTFSLVILSQGFGQTSKKITPDPRLQQVYEMDYLEKLSRENPGQIEYLNFFLDHSFYFSPMPTEKADQFASIPSFEKGQMNILSMNLKRSKDKRTYYRIGDTQELLVMLSEDEFAEKFNKHLSGSSKK